LKVAVDILNDATTKYSANQFFFEKDTIAADMQELLKKSFKEQCFADVPFFQLQTINLPDKYEEAIQLTEVTKQDIQRAQAQREKNSIALETKVKQA